MSDHLPLPDLPIPELDPPGGSGTWRVRATAFRDPVGDAERVASALGLDLGEAQRLVASAPLLIGAGSRREEAERIAAALSALGAKVTVEDAGAPVARPSSIPPRSVPSSPDAEPVRGSEDDAGERSFWAELPVAFLAPLLGKGVVAIVASGLLAGAGWFIDRYVFGIVKLIGVAACVLISIGLVLEVFDKLAQAAASRERGSLPAPHFVKPEASALALRGLSTVLVLVLFGAALWLTARAGLPGIALVALALLFGAYWPMGLAIQGVSGRLSGIFDVFAAARAIAIAPLEYGAVVVVSFVLLIALSVGIVVGGVFAAGATESPSVVVFVIVFLYFSTVTYAHGVLGYAMGALIAAYEDRFAFLVES